MYISRFLSRDRAQLPMLYPAGTRNAHDRASLHTLVCAPRRHVPEEEEASDVSIALQCKCKCNPGRDGHSTRRPTWVKLLLRHLLAPPFSLFARGSVWLHGQFLQVFHRSKRTRMLSEPKGLSRLPCRILATYLISVFKVALALPIYCNPRANRSSQTQIRYLYNYCRLVVPICHIPAAFLTPLS